MSGLFKTIPKSIPQKQYDDSKEKPYKYQGSRKGVVYIQDECKATPRQEKQIEKREQIKEEKTKKKLIKSNYR